MLQKNRNFIFLGLSLIIQTSFVSAQLQNNYWNFGFNCMVDFSGAQPNGMMASAIYSPEQCASVSDELTGQLLFYTDGTSVWTPNLQTMPNGFNLFGGAFQSCTQGPVIVPFPEDPKKYYIFTLDDLEYDNPPLDNGLRYTVVDMTFNSSLQSIICGLHCGALSGLLSGLLFGVLSGVSDLGFTMAAGGLSLLQLP